MNARYRAPELAHLQHLPGLLFSRRVGAVLPLLVLLRDLVGHARCPRGRRSAPIHAFRPLRSLRGTPGDRSRGSRDSSNARACSHNGRGPLRMLSSFSTRLRLLPRAGSSCTFLLLSCLRTALWLGARGGGFRDRRRVERWRHVGTHGGCVDSSRRCDALDSPSMRVRCRCLRGAGARCPAQQFEQRIALQKCAEVACVGRHSSQGPLQDAPSRAAGHPRRVQVHDGGPAPHLEVRRRRAIRHDGAGSAHADGIARWRRRGGRD